jgi:hypothetical protein
LDGVGLSVVVDAASLLEDAGHVVGGGGGQWGQLAAGVDERECLHRWLFFFGNG